MNEGLDAQSLQTRPPTSDELITVVIPAKNEESFIGPCLDSVLAQDEPNLQVLVVDGASTDGTSQIVDEYMERDPRVELLHNPDSIIPTSLNLALEAARGRWLVRVDAHASIPSSYVRRVVAYLRTGEWGGVGGRKDGVGVTPAGRAIAVAMGSRFGVGNSTYHHGTRPQLVEHIPFGAYPTTLVRELGGWDERCVVNQDFEFDFRLRKNGHRLLFDPALAIDWHCRQSIPDLFRQYRRYGRGKALVSRLHPESIRPRHLAAPALVAYLAGAGALALRRPGLAIASVSPYLVGLAAASAAAAPKLDDRSSRPWLPAAFAAMHLGWGIGFWEGLIGMLRPRSRGAGRFSRSRPGTSGRVQQHLG
ncbi:MAG TPA: glycosyltransferase family 2 protein [Actinomycetota bacterium]|nr:glycosyltransferase family 2 protein [Actinomycetota bacterium]